jgi:hypothetical protein
MWDQAFDDRGFGELEYDEITVDDPPDDLLSPTDRLRDELVMTMLGHHVPLSLLVDLTEPGEPESAQIFAEEGEPDIRWWER